MSWEKESKPNMHRISAIWVCPLPVLLLVLGFAVSVFKTPMQSPEIHTVETGESTMKLWINDREIPVTWEENETVSALAQQTALAEITVELSMYGGNEQFGPLGRDYPRRDVQTITHSGDIVLYSGDQIVVFYGSSSWAYTRLGHMNLEAWEVTELLANGDVTLRLTAK